MSRLITRSAIAALALAGGLMYMAAGPSGQPTGMPSTKKGDDRIIYVTTGYRLIELNAKTGQPISGFGKDGVVDLKVGMVTGANTPIDLVNGEAGLHATPAVVKDIVIVGSSFKEGMTIAT